MTDGPGAASVGGEDRAFRALCCVLAASLLVVTTSGVVLNPLVQRWATICVAICVQASPYVLLGVVVSTVVRAVPAGRLSRVLPRHEALAVPVMSVAGLALPGCECGSVPAAATMIGAGIAPGPSVAFMLAAPGANPVVLAATAVAYPGQPLMVAGRCAGSLILATAVGWLASAGMAGRPQRMDDRHAHASALPWSRSGLVVMADELARSLGLLCAGAAATACFVVLIPRGALAALAQHAGVDVVVAACLAVLLGICSQADAFVARSLLGFSRTAQLAFMLVGPAVDLKLLAMQAGAFGPRFALRLSALTLCLAVGVTMSVSAWLL